MLWAVVDKTGPLWVSECRVLVILTSLGVSQSSLHHHRHCRRRTQTCSHVHMHMHMHGHAQRPRPQTLRTRAPSTPSGGAVVVLSVFRNTTAVGIEMANRRLNSARLKVSNASHNQPQPVVLLAHTHHEGRHITACDILTCRVTQADGRQSATRTTTKLTREDKLAVLNQTKEEMEGPKKDEN